MKPYEIVGRGPITVHVIEDKEVKQDIERHREEIDRIWRQTGGGLHPGTLFHLVHAVPQEEGVRIEGCFVDYPAFYAQRMQGIDLGIAPVGVSGIAVADEQYLIGRRAKTMTEYPGMLELIPSGGIPKECLRPGGEVDYYAQVLREFQEETALPSYTVKEVEGFALVFDPAHHVYDIGCRMTLDVERDWILTNFSSEEYSELFFVPQTHLREYLEENRRHMVPATVALLSLQE